MPIATLLLQASDIRDSAHWYWRLQDANGAFLADHTVALDPADWRYEALLDLYGYLDRRVAPDQRRTEEMRLLGELGAWIGEQVLGPIAAALVNQAPVTVRVQILDATPAAAGLCYLPLELAYTGGKPLVVQNAEVLQSNIACHAPALAQARTRFNDYLSLLRLQRYAEAREVLEDCRAIYAAENAVPQLGKVFSALADLEDKLNHRDRAIDLSHPALRYSYLTGNPETCAIGHFNLAELLRRASRLPAVALAHRLAAALIRFQTASGRLPSALQGLAGDLAAFTASPPLPADFAALCAIVEQVEGVRFRDLFERLPKERAADGDAALQQVLALARQQLALAQQQAQSQPATKPRSNLARLGGWFKGWLGWC